MTETSPWKPRTLAAQALGRIEPQTKAIVPPLHVSTTYLRDPDNAYRTGLIYGRPDNETVRHTESIIAALEGAKAALLFGAGMAAATAAVMALPRSGGIVASQVMYWAFRDWLMREAARFGHSVALVDTTDLDVVRAAVARERPVLVWIETPGNPLWTISDIAAIAEVAHAAGARLAVDSTVATPVFSRPLALGADLVMHSASKYLNGHSDVIAGALAVATEDEWWARIATLRTQHGMILGPFEAGCSCAACARSMSGSGPSPRARPLSRPGSPVIRRSSESSTRDCRAIPDTSSPRRR